LPPHAATLRRAAAPPPVRASQQPPPAQRLSGLAPSRDAIRPGARLLLQLGAGCPLPTAGRRPFAAPSLQLQASRSGEQAYLVILISDY